MREILFRGQTRRYGEKLMNVAGDKMPSNWVYGGIFPQNEDGDFAIIYQLDPKIEKFAVYADTVGQYTGLTDKNGVKIFEGDILKRSWADGDVIKSTTYYVEYSLGCFWCKGCSSCCESMLGYFVTLAKGNPIEVIGNIHDNPELLEV